MHDDGAFCIEAKFLDHGTDNIGWRVTEPDTIRFHKEQLKKFGVKGPAVKQLEEAGSIVVEGKTISLDQVSEVRSGEAIAVIIDTRPCDEALELAHKTRLLLCESTYLSPEKKLAYEYKHMTAKEAAHLAKKARAKELVLTHFSARYTDHLLFEQEAQEIFPNTHAAKDLQRFSFHDKRGL